MAAASERIPGQGPTTLAGRISALTGRSAVHIFLVVMALFWITPTIGLLISSFRDPTLYSESGWWNAIVNPNQFTISSYQTVLGDPDLVRGFINTVLITVPSSVLVVLVAALAGYAFAWIDFRGREIVFLVVVSLLVVPLQMALIPVARLYGIVGIFDTIYGAVFFHVAFGLPFAIFLLRNFFIGIPAELLEAARIDGASEWKLFYRVVLPLGMPAIASLFIFQFLWTWNDLLVALVFAPGEASPLTVLIREQLRQFGTNIEFIAPASFILMIVPLIVFFAFQRYFVQGLLAGSVK